MWSPPEGFAPLLRCVSAFCWSSVSDAGASTIHQGGRHAVNHNQAATDNNNNNSSQGSRLNPNPGSGFICRREAGPSQKPSVSFYYSLGPQTTDLTLLGCLPNPRTCISIMGLRGFCLAFMHNFAVREESC